MGVGEAPMSDEEPKMSRDLPLPPPPHGLKFPPPPPPPAMGNDDSNPPPLPPPENEVEHTDEPPFSSFNDDDDSKDFNSMWEKKKQSDPIFSDDNRDRMYGHIDRITTGEVGTLLDRFSDRFGSELDREIIVLRKKQQQAIRDIKPTVELITPPTVEFEEEIEDNYTEESSDSSDSFVEFFDVVNTLLGNMPDEFVNAFVASDDFQLFQSIGESPGSASDEDRTTFFTMINRVLGDLPDDKINEFVESPGFAIFQAMGEIYGA